MFDVRLTIAAEVEDAAACELDEVANTAGGHGLANEVSVSVFISLALSNGRFHA